MGGSWEMWLHDQWLMDLAQFILNFGLQASSCPTLLMTWCHPSIQPIFAWWKFGRWTQIFQGLAFKAEWIVHFPRFFLTQNSGDNMSYAATNETSQIYFTGFVLNWIYINVWEVCMKSSVIQNGKGRFTFAKGKKGYFQVIISCCSKYILQLTSSITSSSYHISVYSLYSHLTNCISSWKWVNQITHFKSLVCVMFKQQRHFKQIYWVQFPNVSSVLQRPHWPRHRISQRDGCLQRILCECDKLDVLWGSKGPHVALWTAGKVLPVSTHTS